MYSLQELSAAAGSTLDINPEFYATSSAEDYVLVNGLYRPVIRLIHDSPSLLQMVHAHGAGPLLMSIDGDDGNCSISILAWDGVYLDERIDLHLEETINLVAAGRVEVEIRCRSQGTFQMVENGEILFYLEVNPPPPEIPPRRPRPVISNEDLQAIVRPWYLQDLLETEEEEIDSTYTVFITQENFNQNLCGFWIGVGSNCGVITPFGSALPNTTENDQCGFHQFGGKRGLDPSVYERDHRLVTFKGAINEWILYGLGSAFHPLHVHVNHMQIISWNSSQDDGADSYYRRGQWRDTIPPIADAVKFRFRAADYEGETVMHCHFQRHEDLGMMDTYLVMNETAYADHYQGTLLSPLLLLPLVSSAVSVSSEHKKNKDDDESAMLSDTVLIAVIVGVGGGILLIGQLPCLANQLNSITLYHLPLLLSVLTITLWFVLRNGNRMVLPVKV
jgi:FtsP/CotA-like multicopper oxidase with cupredoxin domain